MQVSADTPIIARSGLKLLMKPDPLPRKKPKLPPLPPSAQLAKLAAAKPMLSPLKPKGPKNIEPVIAVSPSPREELKSRRSLPPPSFRDWKEVGNPMHGGAEEAAT